MAQPNPFILAADNSPQLLPLLRADSRLASLQDSHGYSLLHATSSYNHLQLIRTLIQEFHVPINLIDEDGETCLYVAETVEMAKCIVEELGVDVNIRNNDGLTAREKIEEEGELPEVAAYLQNYNPILQASASPLGDAQSTNNAVPSNNDNDSLLSAQLPPNVTLKLQPEAANTGLPIVNLEFKRRIDELAASDRFHTQEGQAELRELIKDVVRDVEKDSQEQGRDVRRRVE